MDFIKIKNLIYDYKNHEDESTFRAVDDVNIDVEQGEFIAIIGKNGSGKSTLAKNINALLYPTEGAVFVDNIDTKDEGMILTIRQMAGMVFQNPDDQIVSTVVEEDVAFGPENLALPTNEIRERVDKALDTVEMSEYSLKSPLRLSGGQKQRVAIAGVLAMKPKCLVLDEPTSMLDPVGRDEVLNTLKSLNKEKGLTIILITHHMEEASLADKLFVMNKGKVAMQGSPKEIFKEVEKLKSFGLEVPTVTELSYRLKAEGVDLSDGIINLDEMIRQMKSMK